MKCPICKDGELEYVQEATISYSLLDDGTINKELEICGSDGDTWIYCPKCNAHSSENEELMDIMNMSEKDTSMCEAL